MILTDEERLKFAAYLERDAESTRILIEQMEKMKMPISILMKTEMHAAIVIARKLRLSSLERIG